MEEKEYIKILRDDNLEVFKEKNIVINTYSFITGSYLFIPFFNKKKDMKIANYILDTNPKIDYYLLFWELSSHDVFLNYPDGLLNKILNTETLKSIKEDNSSLKKSAINILLTTDYFRRNRKNFDFEDVNFMKAIDFYFINKRLFNDNSMINLLKEISYQNIIPDIFEKTWKIFRTSSGVDKTFYKSTLDKIISFHPSPESVINLAFNNQEKGIIASVIRNGEAFKGLIAEKEKEEIMGALKKGNKLKNNEKKKRI